MYVPEHFRLPEDSVDALLATVRAGNLITVHADGPMATLLPFHLEERDGARVLVTHMVRNNPQFRSPVTGPALAIIDIADAYVSPLWYATNDELPNVPTWNYLTIHVHGQVQFDASPEGALRAAQALTSRMEPDGVLDLVGPDKLGLMSRAIVGVELKVDRIEAKAKMSQNRHPDDVRSLLAVFEETGPAEMAQYLREVSLPHAEARFGLIERLQGDAVHERVTSG